MPAVTRASPLPCLNQVHGDHDRGVFLVLESERGRLVHAGRPGWPPRLRRSTEADHRRPPRSLGQPDPAGSCPRVLAGQAIVPATTSSGAWSPPMASTTMRTAPASTVRTVVRSTGSGGLLRFFLLDLDRGPAGVVTAVGAGVDEPAWADGNAGTARGEARKRRGGRGGRPGGRGRLPLGNTHLSDYSLCSGAVPLGWPRWRRGATVQSAVEYGESYPAHRADGGVYPTRAAPSRRNGRGHAGGRVAGPRSAPGAPWRLVRPDARRARHAASATRGNRCGSPREAGDIPHSADEGTTESGSIVRNRAFGRPRPKDGHTARPAGQSGLRRRRSGPNAPGFGGSTSCEPATQTPICRTCGNEPRAGGSTSRHPLPDGAVRPSAGIAVSSWVSDAMSAVVPESAGLSKLGSLEPAAVVLIPAPGVVFAAAVADQFHGPPHGRHQENDRQDRGSTIPSAIRLPNPRSRETEMMSLSCSRRLITRAS